MQATFFFRRKWSGFALLALFVMALHAENPVPAIRGGDGVTLPSPPPTPTHPVTDDYQGTQIEDPYRWLEDAKSPQTRVWIDEQNKYTQQYLFQLKNRPAIVQRLTELEHVDQYSLPALRGGKYFFEKRLAGENQASIYVREGWNGTDSRLIDATKLSADQNTSVSIDDIAKNGSLLVYGVRQGGADEESVHVIRLQDRKELPDVLPSDRYFSVNLGPDDKGIYYSVFTHQGTNVYFHRFGTAVQSDSKIFGGEYRGEKLGEIDLIEASMSDNDRYLLLDIAHGVPATRDDILVKDLRQPGSDFVPLVYGIEAQTRALNIGDRFFLETDYQAANKRIVEAVPGGKPEEWKTVIPEGKDVIDGSSIVGGKLFVTRLHDVKTETRIYTLEGRAIGSIDYPGIGSSSGVQGLSSQDEGFYSFLSFIQPPTIFRYDTKSAKSEVFSAPKVPFDTSKY
jgi:prolyl oligopeptidase